jgi:GNAT superfamily N-acetyltransferase
MSRLTMRPATAADLPFIVGLIVADSVVATDDDPTAADPVYAQALAEIDASPNEEVWIACLGDQPIGTFQVSYLPSIAGRGRWRGLLEAVHVSPQHRSGGLGSEMIRWAVERCRDRGCDRVQLTSNKSRKDAHRFYERLGFVASHEGFKLRF